ncbi:MAG: hypothetical protein ACRESO_01930 [Gammaproteobacteria bacterium]
MDKIIIEGIVEREDRQAARRYARQTMHIYRRAVLNSAHFASTPQYRRAFIMSYQFYKHYLQQSATHRGSAGTTDAVKPADERKDLTGPNTETRERYIDAVLDASFPASDPPSWNMGDSRHHKRAIH